MRRPRHGCCPKDTFTTSKVAMAPGGWTVAALPCGFLPGGADSDWRFGQESQNREDLQRAKIKNVRICAHLDRLQQPVGPKHAATDRPTRASQYCHKTRASVYTSLGVNSVSTATYVIGGRRKRSKKCATNCHFFPIFSHNQRRDKDLRQKLRFLVMGPF
jgi:hypothetical protein